MPTSASSPRNSGGGSGAVTKRDFNDLFLILEQHGVQHYATHLADNNYHLHNLDLITTEDLNKLRITNRDARDKLLGVGSWVRFRKGQLAGGRHFDGAGGGGNTNNTSLDIGGAVEGEDHTDAGVSSPLIVSEEEEIAAGGGLFQVPEGATASEYCRQATTFLQHYRVDRAWPKPRSQLAQHLSLPTSRAPKVPTQAFRIKGRPARYFAKAGTMGTSPRRGEQSEGGGPAVQWKEVGQRNPHRDLLDPFPTQDSPFRTRNPSSQKQQPQPQCSHGVDGAYDMAFEVVHEHGKQARSCPVCKRHARERYGDGAWQYRAMVKVKSDVVVVVDEEEVTTTTTSHHHTKKKKSKRQRGGGGVAYDLVPMWIPFSDGDALILETAYRRGLPDALVCGKLALLKRMRWDGRPLRRSHCGSVPFTGVPVRNKYSGKTMIDTMGTNRPIDESDDENDVRRQQATDADIAARIRETFAELLDVEEGRSRANTTAEEDSSYDVLLGRFSANLTKLLAKALRDCEYEESCARSAILHDNDIYYDQLHNDLEEAWCGENIRVLAHAENQAAERLLRIQRGVVEDRESEQRTIIESQEAAAWDLLSKGLRALNKQIRLFVNKAIAESLPTHDSTKCPKCFDATCPFYRKPWHNHWQHVGGPLDLKPPEFGVRSLDALIANTTDIQLDDQGAGSAHSDAHKSRANVRSQNTNYTSPGASFVAGLRPASVGGMKHTSKQPYGTWRLDANNVDPTNPDDDDLGGSQRQHTVGALVGEAVSMMEEGQAKHPAPYHDHHSHSNQQHRVPAPPASMRPATAQGAHHHLQSSGSRVPSRPQSAGPRRQSAPQSPAASASSGVTMSARQRRAEQDARKPPPFRHSVRGLDDINKYTPRSIRDSFEAPITSPRRRKDKTAAPPATVVSRRPSSTPSLVGDTATPMDRGVEGGGEEDEEVACDDVAVPEDDESEPPIGDAVDEEQEGEVSDEYTGTPLVQPPMHFSGGSAAIPPTLPRRMVSIHSHQYALQPKASPPRSL